jgi:zinc protease
MAKTGSHDADRNLLDSFWREPVERSILENGLTLLVKSDRSSALASVQVWVKSGSIHEGTQLGAGLSHFLEHMLFKGTDRRKGPEISATVQANGGYINAYTTFDRTVYYIDLPSENLEVAVDVLADAVFHSTLPGDEVTRERDVILREIAMTKDDPDGRLWEALFATAFREHPYRHPIIGHKDVFSAVDRAALYDYYRERYVPNNVVVVIAGDVDPADARALVEKHFGAVPRSRLAPVLVSSEPLQLGPRSIHRKEKVEITRAALAWPIPGLTDPTAPALDLLGMVLGEGDSSILWQEIREKRKLVHSISASSWNPGSSGLFCISYVCDAGKREEADAAIMAVLKKVSTSVAFTAGQVRKAQRQLVVSEINTRKTMSGQASRLGVAEVVVGDLEFGRSYFERLHTTGPADLRRVLREYVRPERLISVALEPEQSGNHAAKAKAARPHRRPDFQELRLPNGARIVFQEDHRLPNLQLSLLAHGGPMCEAPDRRGSSALLATLLTKDTRSMRAAEVARRIEEVGGSFHSYSGDNSLGLSVEVLPPDAGLGLELLSNGALEPAFRAETLEVEREAQLAGLLEEKDDVVSLARRMLRSRFFGSHPFALNSRGDEKGVAATVPADLASLWKRLFVGPGVVLSVAGDFEASRLIPKLRAFLMKVPKGTPLAKGAPYEGPAKPADFVEKQPREQAVVLQAFPGCVIDADDFHASEVADELFSGMASRLFERVRDQKGLAYFIRSGRVSGLSAAMFFFISGTQPGREDEVLSEIGLEIERVQSGGVSAEELLRCQIRLKAGRRSAMQTNSSRAMHAGLDVLQGRPANHGKAYDSQIDAVTLEKLAAFARRRLQKSKRIQLVVRP